MKYTLSMKSLLGQLKGKKDYDPSEIIPPKGIEKAVCDRFLRVLSAKSMSDISDIPDRELIELFECGEDLATIISSDGILSGEYGLLSKLAQSRSVTATRRVL